MNIQDPSCTAAIYYKKNAPLCCNTTNNNSVSINKLPSSCTLTLTTDNNAELPSPSSTAAMFYDIKNNELSCTNSSSSTRGSPFAFAKSPARCALYNRTLTSIYSNSNVDLSNCVIIGEEGCGKTNLMSLYAPRHDNMLYINTGANSSNGSAGSFSTLSARPSSNLRLSAFFETFARPSDDGNAATCDPLDGPLESDEDVTSNAGNMQVASRSASSIALDGLISPPRR
jgi:hypothetical protein